MLINNKQLKKVKVETQSGQYLGQIIDFELESDTGIIAKYYIKTKISLAGLFDDNKLIITKDQIISFDDQKMIVEDSLVKEKSTLKKTVPEVNKIEGTEPVITSKNS